VSRLGRSLAAVSERPDLEWTFRVVDDPTVNAFALPGGFIYITRGILAHLGSEAELASVVGHEIGHVTARHGVNQMSKAQLAQIGLLSVSVAAPEAMGGALGSLAETGLGLLFLKFGRDDERQADDLGLRYLIADGYDPHPMPLVFDTLRRVSEAQRAGGVPGWMSTHPLPENREQRIADQIAASGRSFAGTPTREQEFLAAVEGIVFGDDPRQGYFDDRTFFHPEMEFRLDFPAGVALVNRRDSVGGISEAKDALIRLALAAEATPAAALDKFLSQDGIPPTAVPGP
jgi:predicted Zn-dependent protease